MDGIKDGRRGGMDGRKDGGRDGMNEDAKAVG